MPKFYKTVPVEFVQFNQLGDHPAVHADAASPTGYRIFTLEHTKTGAEVTPGDWIGEGVAGEFWPVKHEIFRRSYTPVDMPGAKALDDADVRARKRASHEEATRGMPMAA